MFNCLSCTEAKVNSVGHFNENIMCQSILTSLPITGDKKEQIEEQQSQDKAMNILDNKTIILATLLG